MADSTFPNLGGRLASGAAPAPNDVLTWDAATKAWVAKPSTGGGGVPYQVYDPAINLDVYVDATNGNDANTGLSKPQALQTLGALYRKFPTLFNGGARMRVHLAGVGGADPFETPASPGSYPISDLLVGAGLAAEGASYVYRGPTQMPLAAAVPQVPMTVLAAGGTARVGPPIVATRLTLAPPPGWAVNLARGYLARVTRGGNLVVAEFPICYSDATGIEVDLDPAIFAPLFAPGDVVEIVEPGADIVGTFPLPPLPNILAINAPQASGFKIPPLLATDQGFTFERLGFPQIPIVEGPGAVGFDRCRFYAPAGGVPASYLQQNGSLQLVNCIFIAGATLSVVSQTFGAMSRPDSATSPINPIPAFEWLALGRVEMRHGANYQEVNNISIYDEPVRSGLEVGAGGYFEQGGAGFLSPFPFALLQGYGHANYGIECGDGGRARIQGVQGGIPRTTLSGGLGDLLVDGVGPVGYLPFEAPPYSGRFHNTTITGLGQPTGAMSIIDK